MGTHRKVEEGRARNAGQGAQILAFTRRSPPARTRHGPITDPTRNFEDGEERRLMRQNLAAALVIVLLIGSSIWLIDHLHSSARTMVCLEAGRRDCLSVRPQPVQSRW